MSRDIFSRAERGRTTILYNGFTPNHDQFISSAFTSFGYKVEALPTPDDDSLRVGQEYGNRGQCNPTYYTLGNLLKYLFTLRDTEGFSPLEITNNYVLLMAGACGPCRFGCYISEYRRALNDAGFGGLRILEVSQTGGIRQTVASGGGFEVTSGIFCKVMIAFILADCLNILRHRLYPYSIDSSFCKKVFQESQNIISLALRKKESLIRACWKVSKMLKKIQLDYSRICPKVSLVGEFWAMTTYGDGNYNLHHFLEEEGAEVEIQPVINWLLYIIWEIRFDTKYRADLHGSDQSLFGLRGVNIRLRLFTFWVFKTFLKFNFKFFGFLMGLRNYSLSNMDQMAALAHSLYNNQLRGGEGHMEVAKLLDNIQGQKIHMTLSIKPFGCMPSSGVSDGIQPYILERNPDACFLSIETNGEGAVNVYSRIQMQLFRARAQAKREVSRYRR